MNVPFLLGAVFAIFLAKDSKKNGLTYHKFWILIAALCLFAFFKPYF